MSGDALPAGGQELTAKLTAAAARDQRIVGLTLGGSAVVGRLDEFSDLDFVVVCRNEAHGDVLAGAYHLAAGLGTLLVAFTGEHVGEPRLLIALYGSPLLHVDLKFVAVSDLASRVEDGLVLWERGDAVTAAYRETAARWPVTDKQWIEDRFWVWVHYTAAKLGRGELFECLDALATLRSTVLGPLAAECQGAWPQGARRLEQLSEVDVSALEATVAGYSSRSCAAALRATVELYLALRDEHDRNLLGSGPVIRRSAAEAATVAYLTAIEARLDSGAG